MRHEYVGISPDLGNRHGSKGGSAPGADAGVSKALAQLRKDKKTAARIIEDNPKIKENILIEENMRSRYFGLNKSRKRGYER